MVKPCKHSTAKLPRILDDTGNFAHIIHLTSQLRFYGWRESTREHLHLMQTFQRLLHSKLFRSPTLTASDASFDYFLDY
jgi:hypothetical protein